MRGLAGLTALLLTSCATAQASASPATDQACALLEEARATLDAPGMTFAVELPSGAAIEFAVGRQAGGASLTPSTKFLSASIGKTYVAALAIDLHEEGRLDLDSPLATIVGQEEWFKGLPHADRVTLRQLLNHSSGWPSHVALPSFQATISKSIKECLECAFGPKEALAFIKGSDALFPLGSSHKYSESNYLAAGLVIEKVTGKPYYELLQERLLAPLQLRETVPSNSVRIENLSAGRIEAKTNYFGIESSSTKRGDVLLYNPALEWTGGGLAASSADLARWGSLLYRGQALRRPYFHQLFTSVPADPGTRYGLAVEIGGKGSDLYYGHTGSIPGYRSILRHFPSSGITFAAQWNADTSYEESAALLSGVTHRLVERLGSSLNGRQRIDCPDAGL